MNKSSSSLEKSDTILSPKLLFGIIFGLIIFLLGVAIYLNPKSSSRINSQSLIGKDLDNMEQADLSEEKLRQEILKIYSERQEIESFRQQEYLNLISSYGSFMAAIGAFVGIIATILRTSNEITRQRSLDRRQREKEEEQKETERLQKLHERFTTVVKDLGAEQPSIQASAAVSMLSFLRPESSSLHEQVYWILLANLKIDHDHEINRLLVRSFERVIRLQLPKYADENRLLELPLARTHLRYIDLSGLNLSQANLLRKTRDMPGQVDIGFADLQGANLTGTQLQRTRGFEVDLQKARLSRADLGEARLQRANLDSAILHETNLIAADLKYANLNGAQFQQAKLQSAHLNETDLRGAKFEEADLADTHFRSLDPHPGKDVLNSILKAHHWRTAHFDQNIHNELLAMAKNTV